MRKLILAAVLLLLASSASADIEVDIKQECSDREENLISISDPQKTYSHPAEPGYYDNQVCLSGVDETSITNGECDTVTGFSLTGREDQAHFSIHETYMANVCTGNIQTRVTSGTGAGCYSNETALFSVSGEDNAHVADANIFDQKVCGGYIKPDNVSLSLKFNHSSNDNIYFDDQQVSGEQTFDSADYPYIVAEGNNMVSGIVSPDFKSASRRIESENILRLSTSRKSANFIVPYTYGDHTDIENREELVTEEEFLSVVRPSFGYLLPESPKIRVIYDPEVELESSISFTPGRYQFDVVKTGEDRIGLLTPDERTGN
jgi:hypothetical protein